MIRHGISVGLTRSAGSVGFGTDVAKRRSAGPGPLRTSERRKGNRGTPVQVGPPFGSMSAILRSTSCAFARASDGSPSGWRRSNSAAPGFVMPAGPPQRKAAQAGSHGGSGLALPESGGLARLKVGSRDTRRLSHEGPRPEGGGYATQDRACDHRRGRCGADWPPGRRLDGPLRPVESHAAGPGSRDQPRHRHDAGLLQQRRRRASAAGQGRRRHADPRLQGHSGRHPHSGDAVHRTRAAASAPRTAR